jgi:cytochrome P450
MTTAMLAPGPRSTFLLGHLHHFRRDRLSFYTRCAREYGDFVALRLGPRQLLLVSKPEAIEYVLVSGSQNFTKHFAMRINPIVLGNGLLSSEGSFWLRQRRLMQPAFQRQRIQAYGAVMVEHTERLLAGWAEGQERDIHAEMSRLTLGIAAKTLFNADALDKAGEVGAALEVAQVNFIQRFSSLLPIPMFIPTPANLRMRRAVQKLDAIIYGFIKQRRVSGEDKGDLLSMLLHARDEGDRTGMTDKQVRDEAMTLFLAGHETTALTLSWAWYLLSQHPQAAEKLAAEVSSVVGNRRPTVEDLPRLRYTEWVVNETMRLYPPAYVLGREAVRNCEVCGYRIPAGMTVLMSQWILHRDARYFERPEAFEPERWADGLLQRLPKYVYFPFGAGPRVCIGNTFAMMETVLVLATLAQQYRFTLRPGHQVEPWPTFTLRPRGGVPAILARR